MYALLKSFLKKEGLDVNFEELKLQLMSHPSYPSLHAVTGVLNHFNIENMALDLPRNEETLRQLPAHFMAVVTRGDQDELVVVSREVENFELLYQDRQKKKLWAPTFLQNWTGVLVAIEKESFVAGETEKTYEKTTKIISIISVLVMLGAFVFSKPDLYSFLFFIFSLLGLGFSVLIISEELGFYSKVVEKFCTATKNSNCEAVLHSKGASFWGGIKLSDISLIYFFSVLFTLFLLEITSKSTDVIQILSLMAIPVMGYSLYYQAAVIKKWCPLCLGIVAVLSLQCCALFFSDSFIGSVKFTLSGSFTLFFYCIVYHLNMAFYKTVT